MAISQLTQHPDETVRIRGWLYQSRSSGKVAFLVVRDGTGICQCVVEKTDDNAEQFEMLRHLPQESSLAVTGTVRIDDRAPGGAELAATGAEVIQQAESYPITPKAHGVDFLMRHRHLWLRSRRQHRILRVRHTLIDEIRSFFNRNGFTLVDTPIFAPAIGEGASTLFEVDYFGDPVYLAQTGQLYLEAAAMSLGKVYCFGPTFRAEKSKTRRHLTEFWMVEPEMAYAELDDVIAVAEDLVHSLVTRVLNDHRADLIELGRDVEPLERIAKPFDRITYSDAAETLRADDTREFLQQDLDAKKAHAAELAAEIDRMEAERQQPGLKKWKAEQLVQKIAAAREQLADLVEEIGNIPQHMKLAAEFEWGSDLGGSDETIISRRHEQPTFVTHYPKQAKAFYMYTNRQDPRVVNNFDLLAPEGYGEIIGGSQREDDYETLIRRIDEQELPRDSYEWYLDLRRYGSVPHGGFGLGVERTLAWLCGLEHVRETIPFPRLLGRVYP
ncbi:MAG: asparagine--tRNA ligase [Phycisphaerae bacterium]|nr:asparagine--tRNA ligase [Phycisphaerae bacterium]